ncbi:hypothetical protein ACN28E_35545 [Archangium lansingense]|uniref:hypothetical protein n=1 Tax=Archangium lansingense TaxID=2995310 RepID=UPI003B781980
MSPSDLESLASAVQSLATVLALGFGGFWTYKLFVQQRQHYPRARLAHHVESRPFERNSVLLSVALTVTNDGPVLLPVEYVEVVVQQILPPPLEVLAHRGALGDIAANQTSGWKIVATSPNEQRSELGYAAPHRADETGKNLDGGEIEPGESTQYFYQFILSAEVQAVAVRSYFANKRKQPRLGWSLTTLHDLHRDKNNEHEEKG